MPKYLIEIELSGAGELGDDELKETVQHSFGNSVADDFQVQWLESYVCGDKLYCIYHAPDESAINQLAAQGDFSVNSIARIAVSIDSGETATTPNATAEENLTGGESESVTSGAGLSFDANPNFSQSSDSTVKDHTNPLMLPAGVTGDVSSSGAVATSGVQKKEKPRKRLGPVANIVGLVVFGMVGLVLGFGVLMLIPDEHSPRYGKAGKIIKMFPAVVQGWFDRSKASPRGLEHSGGDWKIGGLLQDHEKEAENKLTDSDEVGSSEAKNSSSQNDKTDSQGSPTESKTYRTFTDRTGKHQTEAYLIKFSGGKAQLEKRDGEIKEVPLKKLSAEDQQWLRNELKRRKNLKK